ncbi:MAG: YraN family protein [Alphaproteobacteria bacterium]|nr:MAG: YraN family protein [Alphaproteobacteria bacterium]
MNSYRRGLWAEYYAVAFLLCKGYWPRALRYKTKVGEVDLIVTRGNARVFVEVKYRKNAEDAAYAITPKSRLRIRRAAEQYLLEKTNESPRLDAVTRFDVVIVSNNFLIKHIKNAF